MADNHDNHAVHETGVEKGHKWGMWFLIWLGLAVFYYLFNADTASIGEVLFMPFLVVIPAYLIWKYGRAPRYVNAARKLAVLIFTVLILQYGILDFLKPLRTVRKGAIRMLDLGDLGFTQITSTVGTSAERSNLAALQKEHDDLTAEFEAKKSSIAKMTDRDQRNMENDLLEVKYRPKFKRIEAKMNDISMTPGPSNFFPENWSTKNWVALAILLMYATWLILVLYGFILALFPKQSASHAGDHPHPAHPSSGGWGVWGWTWRMGGLFILLALFAGGGVYWVGQFAYK